METIAKIIKGFQLVIYFARKLHHRCLAVSYTRLLCEFSQRCIPSNQQSECCYSFSQLRKFIGPFLLRIETFSKYGFISFNSKYTVEVSSRTVVLYHVQIVITEFVFDNASFNMLYLNCKQLPQRVSFVLIYMNVSLKTQHNRIFLNSMVAVTNKIFSSLRCQSNSQLYLQTKYNYVCFCWYFQQISWDHLLLNGRHNFAKNYIRA